MLQEANIRHHKQKHVQKAVTLVVITISTNATRKCCPNTTQLSDSFPSL